jgi:hypothetical protein
MNGALDGRAAPAALVATAGATFSTRTGAGGGGAELVATVAGGSEGLLPQAEKTSSATDQAFWLTAEDWHA